MNDNFTRQPSELIAQAFFDSDLRDKEVARAIVNDPLNSQLAESARQHKLDELSTMQVLFMATSIMRETERKLLRDGLIQRSVVMPVQPWIKVTDRLPDRYVDVLIRGHEQSRVRIDVARLAEGSRGLTWFGGRFTVEAKPEFVSHWMPLPENP